MEGTDSRGLELGRDVISGPADMDMKIISSILYAAIREVESRHAELERLRLEKERLDLEALRKMQSVRIALRPVDCDWVMGEDWPVDFPLMSTMSDLLDYIEAKRNICRYRIQLRLKGDHHITCCRNNFTPTIALVQAQCWSPIVSRGPSDGSAYTRAM